MAKKRKMAKMMLIGQWRYLLNRICRFRCEHKQYAAGEGVDSKHAHLGRETNAPQTPTICHC